MKSIFFTLLTLFVSSSFANDEIYFGPIQNCTLNNETNILETIEMAVYTAGIFGPSETIQVVYGYPVLDETGETALTFISQLSTDDVDSGVYKGKFTNVSYLVDVTFDMNSGTLTMLDRDTVFEFTGSCTVLQ
jgi:hypothetical protein